MMAKITTCSTMQEFGGFCDIKNIFTCYSSVTDAIKKNYDTKNI